MKRPDPGEEFTATIDQISDSGNGIIVCSDGHINIGPVTPDAVGEEVTAVMGKSRFAICQTDHVKDEEYDSKFHVILSNSPVPNEDDSRSIRDTPVFNSLDIPPSKRSQIASNTLDGEEAPTYSGTERTLPYIIFCDECGAMAYLDDDQWNCRSCGHTFSGPKPEFPDSSDSDDTSNSDDAPDSDDTSNSGFSVPEEKFTATIDRISDAGDGIVVLDDGTMNVGPIDPSAVGEEVLIQPVWGRIGKCLTSRFIGPDYEHNIKHLLVHSDIDSSRDGGTDDDGWPYCPGCGTFLYRQGDTWVCHSCGHQTTLDGMSLVSPATSDEEGPSPQTTPSQSPETESQPPRDMDPTAAGSGTESPDLDELRRRAEESAVENVPTRTATSATTSSTAPQYNRSGPVRRYVMERANGTCEGCGDPAPFVSRTGEPYLHAHHVHELSEGGSDTPDTVIALCPNCHYRVHHGEDGEQYNQELLERVQAIEAGR